MGIPTVDERVSYSGRPVTRENIEELGKWMGAVSYDSHYSFNQPEASEVTYYLSSTGYIHRPEPVVTVIPGKHYLVRRNTFTDIFGLYHAESFFRIDNGIGELLFPANETPEGSEEDSFLGPFGAPFPPYDR